MAVSFSIKETFPVKPKTLFQAWLNSEVHAAMTGGEAECSDEINGQFSAWDGYISGTNTSLVLYEKITQRWRTTEFEEEDPDSILELEFLELEEGCQLTLTHSNIPEGQSDYKKGWIEHYFEPMSEYFSSKSRDENS